MLQLKLIGLHGQVACFSATERLQRKPDFGKSVTTDLVFVTKRLDADNKRLIITKTSSCNIQIFLIL